MELDTGASVSLMSEEAYQQIQDSGAALRESKARLYTYTGDPVGVLGTTEVRVEHNNQTAVLPLIITQGTGPALLGRNWLSALDLDWKQ